MANIDQLTGFAISGEVELERAAELEIIYTWMASGRPVKLSEFGGVDGHGWRNVDFDPLAEEDSSGPFVSSPVDFRRSILSNSVADYLTVPVGTDSLASNGELLVSNRRPKFGGPNEPQVVEFAVTRYRDLIHGYDILYLGPGGKVLGDGMTRTESRQCHLENSLYHFFARFDEDKIQELSEANGADSEYF